MTAHTIDSQKIELLASQLKYCTDDERIELIAAIQRKETYLKVLNSFAVSLIQIKHIDDLLWYVAQEVVSKLGFVDCVVYRYDSSDQTLVQHAAMGDKSPEGRKILHPLRIPLGTGVTGRVAAQAMPILVNDLSKFPGYVEDMSPALSEICVPLTYGGEILGVIDCEDPRRGHFTDEHLEVLSSVAAMTSSKIKECEFVARLEEQNSFLQGREIELERALKTSRPAVSDIKTDTDHSARILVAEDHHINQVIISQLVKSFGWDATIVADGAEALKAIESGDHYDLVLMDIRMPNMDGVEATLGIRAREDATSGIPIVALTANSQPDDAARYLSAGMNAVVGKPIDKGKLYRTMAGLLEQKATSPNN